ncbi:MAG TPA: rhodanese-like domain-containing protein [Kofleriaceae bacterium]|jgi:rhodanese-related sulfurtransferase
MRNFIAASILAGATLLGSAPSMADAPKSVATAKALPEVTVDQLDQLLSSHKATPVDANGDSTRKRMGVVPGAILLSDADSTAGLPADKGSALIFYCGNTACKASHNAAEKAMTAGYTNVKVMPAGIAGWVQAGKKVQQI